MLHQQEKIDCNEDDETANFLVENKHDVLPVPVTAPSTARVCGRSPAEIVGSNPTGGMDLCLLHMWCVVSYRFMLRADHSSRGVLPTGASYVI